MSAATLDVERPVEARPPLTEADRARIRAEQRGHNLRAVRLYAVEHPLRGAAPPTLADAIEFWKGDAPAISGAHLALTRLSILIEHAALSEIAARYARAWIDDAREALARFETPWGPST
jgi:hypothetical protein